MIVKVQLSMPDKGRVLIYDVGRKHVYEGKSTPEIVKLMAATSYWGMEGGFKAFFEAKLVPEENGGIRFQLGKAVKFQNW